MTISKPGEGITISMLDKTSQLKVSAQIATLGIFSTSRPYFSSLPLFLYPESPTGQSTNSFDLHARQSIIDVRYTGPEVFGLTPGAETVTLFFNETSPMTIMACSCITLMAN